MPSESLPSPLSRNDYEAIEAAVMETERGRWFLTEYARRNRHADTERVLDAIATLQDNLNRQRDEARLEKMRKGLLEMARAIAVTHVEIERLRPQGLAATRLDEASGELDAIVHTTEEATSAILQSAEQVQEHAWTLREQAGETGLCDALDACATEIYVACGFQDLTAQRTRKVIDTLTFVENRIQSLMEVWDIELPPVEGPTARERGGMAPPAGADWPANGDHQAAADVVFDATPVAPPPVVTTQPEPPSATAFAAIDALSVEDRLKLFR